MAKALKLMAEDGFTPLAKVRRSLEWVKRKITANPSKYDQRFFFADEKCGSIGCIAGWLDVRRNGMKAHMSRKKVSVIIAQACAEIGLPLMPSSGYPWLFYSSLTNKYKRKSREAAEMACMCIDLYLTQAEADARMREIRKCDTSITLN